MEYNDLELKKILSALVDTIRMDGDAVWDWSPDTRCSDVKPEDLSRKRLLTHWPPHINRCMEICVCLQGHAYIQLEDRTVVLEPGQFFVVPPGTLHNECIPADEDAVDLWLNMRQKQKIRVVISGIDADGEHGILYCRAVLMEPLVKSAFMETLDKELNSSDYGSHILVKNRMVDTLIAMIRYLEQEGQGESQEFWRRCVVSEVIDYLNHHNSDRVELQDLADHMGISIKHLNRIFKAATGNTIVNHANQIRLDQAKYYLTATELKVKDIAQLLNYYNQYHFGRIFKNATGKSPMEFRKSKREE